MHALLERQLRKAGFSIDALPRDIEAWQAFLTRVERYYKNADSERLLWQVQAQKTAQSISTDAATDIKQIYTVLSSLTAGVCAFDLDDKLLFMNGAAENYLKLPIEQTVYLETVLEYFVLEEEEEACLDIHGFIEQVKTGQYINKTNIYLKIQQPETIMETIRLPVVLTLNPIQVQGKVVGSVLWFEDISEIKQAEAALIAAKESAEQASSSKSKFLSSMSHELRTPMNAILGYSEILQEDLGLSADKLGDSVEDMQQYVGNILQAAWHLLELINKVLDLSRIEAGKLEVSIEPTDLIDLIKECVSIVAPSAEKRNININNTTESMTPQDVLVDRSRLKQVIINLLSNAVKYNCDEGRICIRMAQSSPRYLRLEIQDTGEGLAPDQQDKIFEPFTRLSGVNLIEGTGIGLTITKQLMELMDGHIGVESEVGVGSSFWIEVPTSRVELEEGNVFAHPDEVQLRKFMLLYIEDSRTNVSLVAQVLKARPNIALMSAHTGEMGLELARMHKPTVILLDINLPGMDGYAVLKALKKDASTQHIPVLALTAIDSENDPDSPAEQSDFFRYIVKPLDIKNFLMTIDEALEQAAQHEIM